MMLVLCVVMGFSTLKGSANISKHFHLEDRLSCTTRLNLSDDRPVGDIASIGKGWKIDTEYWDSKGKLGPKVVADNSKPLEVYEEKSENKVLWANFAHKQYQERNKIFVEYIHQVKPKRVFEFAGNGGFLPRLLVTDREYGKGTDVVDHWVHSEFNMLTLQYASFVLGNGDVTYLGEDFNIDRLIRNDCYGRSVDVPMKSDIDGTTFEVVEIDMSDVKVLKESIDFSYFDMITTISYEHFRDDLDMIRDIFPSGAWFLFSVASFPHPEHFRHFKTEESVHERYGEVMDIVSIRPAKMKFIVLGKVK